MDSDESDMETEAEGSASEMGDREPMSSSAFDLHTVYGSHTWELDNFLQRQGRLISEPFEIGGFQWQMLVFPQGNYRPQHASLYLLAADASTRAPGWQRAARLALTLVSAHPGGDLTRATTQHVFSESEVDWGYSGFVKHSDLLDIAGKGFMTADGRVRLKVEVWVAADAAAEEELALAEVGKRLQTAALAPR